MDKYRDDDPLTRALAPPADETSEQADARLLAEKAARDRSNEINKELEKARRSLDKRNKDVIKMLILGQSGSGRSS